MSISRFAIVIMAVAIQELNPHLTIIERRVEGICHYILSIFVRRIAQRSLVVQTALAIRSRHEEVLAEVVLQAPHDTQGIRSLQLSVITIGNQVISRTTQIIQIVGIAMTVCCLIIKGDARREGNHPAELGSQADDILVLSFHQVPIRKETKQVGPADVALSIVPFVLNVRRQVGNPLLDAFGSIGEGGISGGRHFDGACHTPMVIEPMVVL